LLAMSTRLLLQPATVSYLLLAVALWLICSKSASPAAKDTSIPSGWPLMLLFVIWANADSWFVLGLGTVALIWLGQVLDAARQQRAGVGAFAGRRLILFVIVAGVCLVNPAHVNAFRLPPELTWLPYWSYLANYAANPAGLAYIPLLLLGALSFALNLPGWQWQRFLPWLGLAVLS